MEADWFLCVERWFCQIYSWPLLENARGYEKDEKASWDADKARGGCFGYSWNTGWEMFERWIQSQTHEVEQIHMTLVKIKTVHSIKSHQVMSIGPKKYVITFKTTNLSMIQYLNDDPLIISLQVANYIIKLVLVDTRSNMDLSMHLIRWACLEKTLTIWQLHK